MRACVLRTSGLFCKNAVRSVIQIHRFTDARAYAHQDKNPNKDIHTCAGRVLLERGCKDFSEFILGKGTHTHQHTQTHNLILMNTYTQTHKHTNTGLYTCLHHHHPLHPHPGALSPRLHLTLLLSPSEEAAPMITPPTHPPTPTQKIHTHTHTHSHT